MGSLHVSTAVSLGARRDHLPSHPLTNWFTHADVGSQENTMSRWCNVICLAQPPTDSTTHQLDSERLRHQLGMGESMEGLYTSSIIGFAWCAGRKQSASSFRRACYEILC
jgi:hypothetical protein